ncbi:MAG: HAD family phosphatase [Sphingomonas sp.]|jgi:HAD superfamily hydrolase (TIGR01509 family)|nr:HAD family phosphatase [Sphingomonas sp.]
MRFDAIIFDFDGVLLESEFEGNRLIARLLTDLGHPTTEREAVEHFTGLSGRDFIAKVEARMGREVPNEFQAAMNAERDRTLAEGIAAVLGAVEFVRALPPSLPKAVASSSSTRWIRTHLAHLGLGNHFEPHIYSGKEHVERGKPAPDLYLHAARELGVDISRSVIIEDSKIGAIGALASGGAVIGLAAGSHCFDGHADMLRGVGVKDIANSFDEVAALVGLVQPSR